MNSFDILRRPIITEKSTTLQEQNNRYVFEVAKTATKHQIKRAVQEAFEVSVVKVNTMNVRGKTKRMGPRVSRKSDWAGIGSSVAIVTCGW